MYKNVIFDLDGTLINSIYDLAYSMNKALEENGLESHDVYKYNYFIGDGVDMLIKRAMCKNANDKELFKKVKNNFNMYYEKHKLDKTAPYNGVKSMLKELNEKNIKVSILSNKPDEFVKSIVEKLFSDIKFTICFGKKEEYKIKPSPESLLAIIDELKADLDTCLYVGDSDVDVLTAHNAQVQFCGVEWGFRGKDELLENGAKVTVTNADELLKYIIG